MTRKMFCAGVARVFNPGTKFDYVVTLVGGQGIGKSYIIGRIGKKWSSDSMSTVIGKEEDGRIYISILSPKADDAKVKFYFEHPHLCTIKALGGTPTVELSVLSARSALAWVASMTALMPYVLITNWVDKSQQNQNNGGGNNGGGNGGGYQNSNNNNNQSNGGGNAPDPDDMPF